MIIKTYQSVGAVRALLETGEYMPTICRNEAYKLLVDLFDMPGAAPVFCYYGEYDEAYCGGAYPQGNVLVKLDVPRKECFFTEFYTWSDVLFFSQFPKELENSNIDISSLLNDLKKQRCVKSYDYPQVLLHKIKKEWLVGMTIDNSEGL